ncbi:septum formation inhibitor Maf [Chromobacterium subtsugae]|uniref:dTTP/UTP pyrophosphatase n=1 Tax=Chromobacterium subtsugae TaxID=251747 RepID=A0ABS7F7X3_9NEIS|nr:MULTISPECIES: Maf family protein [Chromobacterium]KUM01771.1 septum formation inhibitor Maf [Chromobacterium subtsugae]KZE83254.1 septum formation inhibitor Maf [Chromobacterium sp. F49]MBW7567221.1 septum formation inhibitor Maf [Chromobacterium subtsugae]MBW8286191.1 septum formation inhibitor Maf [Chromobacterium subtsugae]OBU87900.1 septum formation inhibitor Maf [Chromobacterium subtsugae]
MSTNDTRIYLASGSPRRREILEQLGLHLERIHADIDESVLPGEDAVAYTERLAREKAEAGWKVVSSCGLPERPLLAADTTVTQDGEIFGKPADADDARRMLRAFSGRSHQAITSVAVMRGARLLVKTSVTDVFFKPLSDAEIERYLASGEPFDKAGAYGIQGKAGVFVEHIEGSYTGVMGLPVHETALLLAEFGFELP